MPSLDQGRLRARLAPQHVTAVAALLAGGVPDAVALADLRATGLVDGDRPDPLLEAVVRALAPVQLACSVEVSGPAGTTVGLLTIAGDTGCLVTPWPGEHEADHALVSSALFVPALAVSLGLVPGPTPADRVPLVLPLRVVDGTLQALSQLQGDAAWETARRTAEEVVAREAPGSGAGPVVAALRRAVRLTTSRPDGTDVRSVVLLDAGAHGWWRRDLPAEPLSAADVGALTPDSPVTLVPLSSAEVWQALVDLLP